MYAANLQDGNSYDLLILRDIVLMMSGVETSTGMSQDLIQAACGGPKLLLEVNEWTLYFYPMQNFTICRMDATARRRMCAARRTDYERR